MANETNTAASPFLRSLFSAGFYKRSQGRIARQATFFVLLLIVALGAWRLVDFLQSFQVQTSMRYGISLGLLMVFGWLSFRLVNIPKFADFLIAVEAEMNKVSWPSRTELIRSSIVVIITIVGLVFVLFAFDVIWKSLLNLVGVPG